VENLQIVFNGIFRPISFTIRQDFFPKLISL